MTHYDLIIHDFLGLLEDCLGWGSVLDMKVTDTCDLGYIVSNFCLWTNVAIQQALSLLSNDRNTSEKLLLSALHKLAIDRNCFNHRLLLIWYSSLSRLWFLNWVLIHKFLPVAHSSDLLSILCFLFDRAIRSNIRLLFFRLYWVRFRLVGLSLYINRFLCLYLHGNGLFWVAMIYGVFNFTNFSFCTFNFLIDTPISATFYLEIFEVLPLFLILLLILVGRKAFRVFEELSLKLIIVLIFSNVQLDAFPGLLSVEEVDWRGRLQH